MKQVWCRIRLLGLLVALFGPVTVAQAAGPVVVEVFERQDCVHCAAERDFLHDLEAKQNDSVTVVLYDIDRAENKELFAALTRHAGLPRATPLTIIGTQAIQGFADAETTGEKILAAIAEQEGREQLGARVIVERGLALTTFGDGAICDDATGICRNPQPREYVTLPFLGKVNVLAFSLPVMAALLGFVDGFNPCAMWVLVTFLLVLIQLRSRSRMFSVAGLFIVAEAIMYYLILNVWFTTWDFVGLDRIVTPIVGLLAVGGGLFFLYEWKTANGTCKIINPAQRSGIIARVKALAHEPLTLVSVVGIIGLAFSVNVIEFACSIGIPQAFTKILELNQLDLLAEQGLMALYILFYMVDDILVFGLALWGTQKLSLTERYSHFSNLLGGILMILLGVLLIVAPQVLRFSW